MRRTSHPPLFRILLTALLLALGTALAPSATAAPAAAPVRIMPLGDSITGSPGCWRAVLWNRLQNTGYRNIDFVGTLKQQGCPQALDGDNEGHGGELVTNVANQKLLPGRLAATHPDIVVMHFGTNDVWSSISPDTILAAYTKLVQQMRASNPDMKILVAQLIPMNPSGCADCGRRVVALNTRIPGWARATSTSRSPVTVVDQWTGFNTSSDTYDGVHPSASGNEKIAARWYPALTAALDKSVPGSPGGDPACAASFRAVSSWQDSYQGEVTVTNASASRVTGWTATVVPAGGAHLTQVWNGSLGTTTADGRTSVGNTTWNGALAPGASTTFGFTAGPLTAAGTPSAAVSCTAQAALS
ncbi:GDSL-type esterase/lipase family protein [Streptomyces griseiscabiei]|uniref:GDSL-type esterase/lipase family protein n=1 Tax=Streptomyces griseiscabiei TaxID=2993540 RepID=A0ABU4LFP3_9ACTN|nr:GDSL-type esterase/lipase family protein [Streptomyces griseiscabiei]MBZ3900067.1 cellulose binding domain-containing protein [Streptomyces griseiscabiei]MDX2914607.1 GDSL-type esterase/lipase family protein [Streptomyces griseiscabiei]